MVNNKIFHFIGQSTVGDVHETPASCLPEQFSLDATPTKSPEGTRQQVVSVTGKNTQRTRCGWIWFRPGYLQRFRTAKWALFWLCWAGAMQGTL